jgi:Ca-activated chloride channel homolog
MAIARIASNTLFVLVLASLAACHGQDLYGAAPPDVGSPGDLGATPGGQQDIGYVRDLIAQGGVPVSSAIAVEGLLSEHDLPAKGPACDSVLCLRPALGRAPSLETGETEYWIQIGMASGLGEFSRPPLDLVVVIDKSSSMSIDMDETNEAVVRLIEQLGPEDRLAVLAFDDQLHTIAEFGELDDAAALMADVRGIRASGGFEIARATREAYEILAQAGDDPRRLRRVVLLSCGYPSIHPDLEDPYSEMVLGRGYEGIGLSFFGVLLGYDSRLAKLLGTAWGGSYGYIQSLEQIEKVFDEDFDFMMTPLAYDLAFRMEVGERFEIARLYGIPADADGEARPAFEVATAFPSRRRGAIAVRLTPAGGGEEEGKLVSEVSLSYLPEPAIGGEGAIEETSAVTIPDGIGDDEAYWATGGVRKLAALVNMAERMKAAVDAYHEGDPSGADAILAELVEHLAAEAEALDDDDLAAELDLLEALRANMAR